MYFQLEVASSYLFIPAYYGDQQPTVVFIPHISRLLSFYTLLVMIEQSNHPSFNTGDIDLKI